MDGFEVLRRLGADDRLRHVAVIVVSALSDPESVARCIELGADDYLSKPFDSILLRARVSASLERKRARDREAYLLEQLRENRRRLGELEDGAADVG
jgi:PleD family two-component response regulator